MSEIQQNAGHLRLGVNIDHVATIRNARGGQHPDPLHAAKIAVDAGADGITAHLREDRRHISDDDIARLMATLSRPLNFEMAATAEMLEIALKHRPHAACIVPERRQELTTEGGLDVVGGMTLLKDYVRHLRDAGLRVSLFIDPDKAQIEASAEVEADIVELHTGTYCEASHEGEDLRVRAELVRLEKAATHAHAAGLEVHAGHGLTFDTVSPIAALPEVVELNIGHFLIGEAIFGGLHSTIQRMRSVMDTARAERSGTQSA